MTQPDVGYRLAEEIRRLLHGLRRRIRVYVWCEGLALAVIWLGVTFWCGLALDYLPVWLGASEMPRGVRGVLLAGTAAITAWILYRWVWRRAIFPLTDRSLALLLERRFPEFSDSLVTSVEMVRRPTSPGEYDLAMLAETHAMAQERSRRVKLREIFNFRPLAVSLFGALAFAASVLSLYAVNANAVELWAKRLYLLQDEPWPRRARIEVVGIEAELPPDGAEGASYGPVRSFENSTVKAARGSNLRLLVRAQTRDKVVPEVCSIHYRTAEGERGWLNMDRVGRPREGYQTFAFAGAPFSGLLGDLQFDVLGYDHRLRGFTVRAVDSPTLIGTRLACQFPDYMVDEALGLRLPQTIDYTPGMSLPRGTKVTLQTVANKPLQRATIRTTAEQSPQHVDALPEDSRRFDYELPPLSDTLNVEIQLLDTDDVASDRPLRLTILAIEDQSPTVEVGMRGIGSVVTPDVLIPLRGQVRDDYGVAKTWLEMTVNSEEPRQQELTLTSGQNVETDVDFREMRSQEGGLELKPKDKLVLTVKAEDRFNLDSSPHSGVGDRFELQVVTADQLLASLEARELGLRRRFEQIIEEMTETRDSLLRLQTDPMPSTPPVSAASTAVQEEDRETVTEPEPPATDDPVRELSLRILRVQRALLQSQKSGQETLGVAAGFRDIRDELTNNRLDTEDRKTRLSEQIASPLQAIGDQRFPELDAQLAALQLALEKIPVPAVSTTEPMVAAAIATTNGILLEMQRVLSSMLDLETYNELLDIVRSLIDEQQQLIDQTKKQQKKQALDLLK